MRAVMAILGLLALGGCASDGRGPWSTLPGGTASCTKLTAEQELSVSMADDMANEGRLHASLANLQRLPGGLGQVRVREARIYRLLGRSEAEPLYRSLLGTCLAAQGEHGLGQLSAARGDNGQAMNHLQRAARIDPVDEKIRNDLGVVYLNQGRLTEARFEFLTAMELKQDDSLAAINLVTLLIHQDNWQQATEVVARAGLSPQQVTDAQARAEKLKHPSKVQPAPADQVAVLGNVK